MKNNAYRGLKSCQKDILQQKNLVLISLPKKVRLPHTSLTDKGMLIEF